MTKIIFWVFVVDIILTSAFVVNLYVDPWSKPFVANFGHKVTVGPATGYFLQQLKSNHLAPVAVERIIRQPFTVPGSIITLDGDNFIVFEYPDQRSAAADAAILTQKYASSTRSAEWKKKMHVDVYDTLVIFYMGSKVSILETLAQNAPLLGARTKYLPTTLSKANN
ncbi:MAG: hypothetical protein WCO03_00370 [bacterium]